MKSMSELEDDVAVALATAGVEIDKGDTAEPSLFLQLIWTFRGVNAWASWLVLLMSFVFFVLGITCVVRFLDAPDVKAQIFYATGFLTFLIGMCMMKVWFWLHISRNAILRAVREHELLNARLAQRVRES